MFPNQLGGSGLFGKGLGSLKSINWSGLLDGTQKTLGVINQAIPIVYQIKPIISNAKTMFRIADVIKSPSFDSSDSITTKAVAVNTTNKPVFYI